MSIRPTLLNELETQIHSTQAGADGIALLPYLNGERTPDLPDGNAVIHGLNGTNATPAHFPGTIEYQPILRTDTLAPVSWKSA